MSHESRHITRTSTPLQHKHIASLLPATDHTPAPALTRAGRSDPREVPGVGLDAAAIAVPPSDTKRITLARLHRASDPELVARG